MFMQFSINVTKIIKKYFFIENIILYNNFYTQFQYNFKMLGNTGKQLKT